MGRHSLLCSQTLRKHLTADIVSHSGNSCVAAPTGTLTRHGKYLERERERTTGKWNERQQTAPIEKAACHQLVSS